MEDARLLWKYTPLLLVPVTKEDAKDKWFNWNTVDSPGNELAHRLYSPLPTGSGNFDDELGGKYFTIILCGVYRCYIQTYM